MTVHILSQIDGRHRGGRANPIIASHNDDEYTPAQLRELLGDPTIAVVIGGERLTEAHIAALEPTHKKPGKG